MSYIKEIDVNGILVLYYSPLITNAPTILEHINSFKMYSQFETWSINTELGFSKNLERLRFRIIVLHYSLFALKYQLNNKFSNYLNNNKYAYKIAFFQDEYRYCQQRFNFINEYRINCVYTSLEPDYFKDIYLKYTNTPKLVSNLPGYVSEELIFQSGKLTIPIETRSIDIGYRARRLDYYMGRGAQEKHQIGMEFKKRAKNYNLVLDIETEESKRIYGRSWYQFLANCRFILGVEAGVSIFDIEDRVREECAKKLSSKPGITFEEISKMILYKWEDNIYYRSISPRHFEAAASRVCQILFEGKYSGILKPMVHYIPLKKDFSNFDDVIKMLEDKKLCSELIANAYRDLIASDLYSYRKFIGDFDQELIKEGFRPGGIAQSQVEAVTAIIQKGQWLRNIYGKIKVIRYKYIPGNNFVISYLKYLIERG
ncbi:MAG: hypothetical protein WC980_06870 [Candidatus Brocadiia bacterium]